MRYTNNAGRMEKHVIKRNKPHCSGILPQAYACSIYMRSLSRCSLHAESIVRLCELRINDCMLQLSFVATIKYQLYFKLNRYTGWGPIRRNASNDRSCYIQFDGTGKLFIIPTVYLRVYEVQYWTGHRHNRWQRRHRRCVRPILNWNYWNYCNYSLVTNTWKTLGAEIYQ